MTLGTNIARYEHIPYRPELFFQVLISQRLSRVYNCKYDQSCLHIFLCSSNIFYIFNFITYQELEMLKTRRDRPYNFHLESW